MNSFIVILSCLAALTTANPTQDVLVEYLANGNIRCRANCRSRNPLQDCPPVSCPPPVRNGNCGMPDCSLPGNRLRLHPAQDANFFFQCVPDTPTGPLRPQLRPCACGSVFSAARNDSLCVHPAEYIRDCPNQPIEPILSLEFCQSECPTCDDNGNPTPRPPPDVEPTPPPVTTPPPVGTPPPGNDCPCVCFPCIWWPCMPCANNCPCGNNNNQQQRPQQPPQNPWQPPKRPQPQPPQNPWEQRPQNPWEQLPQQPQNPWEQLPQQPQNPWEQPQQPQNPWEQLPQQPQNPWEQPRNPWEQPQQPQQPWEQPQHW